MIIILFTNDWAIFWYHDYCSVKRWWVVITTLITWLAPWADKMTHALWLATWAGKMELSCPLGTTCCVLPEKFPQKPYNKPFFDQDWTVKMAGYWLCSFFVSLWTSTSSQSINTQKRTWPISSHLDLSLGQKRIYYMASSVSRQDEPNRVLWLLPERARWNYSILPARDYPPCPMRKIPLVNAKW